MLSSPLFPSLSSAFNTETISRGGTLTLGVSTPTMAFFTTEGSLFQAIPTPTAPETPSVVAFFTRRCG